MTQKRTNAVLLMALAVLVCMLSDSVAETRVFSLSESELISYESPEMGRGDVVVVNWTPPSILGNRKIFSAFLEFNVELTSPTTTAYRGQPVIDVRELSTPYTGTGTLDARAETAMVAGSVDMESGLLRVDIRPFVEKWLSIPGGNRGLVIGNIGDANVSNIQLQNQTPGKIVVKYR